MAKKKTSLGCLFYTALVLLLIVLFLFQWGKVREVVEGTGFLQKLQGKGAAVAASPGTAGKTAEAAPKTAEPAPRKVEPAPQKVEPAPQKAAPAPQKAEPAPRTPPSPPKPAPAPRTADTAPRTAGAAPKTAEAAPKAPAAAAAPPPAGKPETRTRRARLYFVSVDNGGGIALREVSRNVEYTDAPLTSTLLALLKGPTPGEGQAGLLSAIPADSRLNEVTVKDGTAYLDFNESFRFNALGEEGLRAQLRQIVWSATEFPNLTRVQFLIDGRQVKYLGPEGTFIGEPLSRQSFR